MEVRKLIGSKMYSLRNKSQHIDIADPVNKEFFTIGTIIDTALELPPNTGLTHRLVHLSEALAERGHRQVWFLANRNHHDLDSVRGLVNDFVKIHLLSPELFYDTDYLSSLIKEEGIDILQFELTETFLKIGRTLRENTGIPVVQEIHDVEAELRKSLGRDDEVDLAAFMQFAGGTLADSVITMTPHDRDALISHIGLQQDKVFLAPNGVAVRKMSRTPKSERPTLVFLGNMFYPPNQEGLLYTLSEVLPLLKIHYPDLAIRVVGMVPPEVEAGFAGSNIAFTGPIADMDAFWRELESAWLGLCVLFSGSGMKVKILDYCLAGLPIITTPLGASGYEKNQDLVIVDASAEAIADQILCLLKSPAELWRTGDANYAYVVEHHSWSTIIPTVEAAYRHAFLARSRAATATERIPIPMPFWFTEGRHEQLEGRDHFIISKDVRQSTHEADS